MARSDTKTKASQLRAYQVMGMALAEEKRLGLISEEEFTRRHRELFNDIFGERQ